VSASCDGTCISWAALGNIAEIWTTRGMFVSVIRRHRIRDLAKYRHTITERPIRERGKFGACTTQIPRVVMMPEKGSSCIREFITSEISSVVIRRLASSVRVRGLGKHAGRPFIDVFDRGGMCGNRYISYDKGRPRTIRDQTEDSILSRCHPRTNTYHLLLGPNVNNPGVMAFIMTLYGNWIIGNSGEQMRLAVLVPA